MRSRRLSQLLLGAIALLLLLLLFSCSAGDGGRSGSTVDSSRPNALPTRLILGRSEAGDSIAPASPFFVDQSIRAAIDSIPGMEYVTIDIRDSLADRAIASGGTGLQTSELGRLLGVDGVIFARIERFGSVAAAEMRIVSPVDDRLIFRSVAWSFIRYRDSAGTMYLGPTLYDLMRQLLGRYYGMRQTTRNPVATEPLVVTSLVIPHDRRLGQIAVRRDEIAISGVKALGEFARRHYPELVGFDYDSRAALYRTVNIRAVIDCIPPGNRERLAMFNLGIERYVIAITNPVGTDSLVLRVEIRSVVSSSADTLVDAEERRFSIAEFQTSSVVDNLVVAVIDLAEPLFRREAQRVSVNYEAGPAKGGRAH